MLPIKSSYMVIMLLPALCLLAAAAALEPSMSSDQFADNALDDKVNDAMSVHKRPSFFVGSRYGRSGSGSSPYGSSKMRRLNVVPRNDRFFLGSRYGKRAGEYMSAYEQDTLFGAGKPQNDSNPGDETTNSNAQKVNNSPYMMSCVYTGLRNLYRCNSIEEINNIINQLTTAQTDEDAK